MGNCSLDLKQQQDYKTYNANAFSHQEILKNWAQIVQFSETK